MTIEQSWDGMLKHNCRRKILVLDDKIIQNLKKAQ